MSGPRFLILGAGPTGLGAASRLHELGHREFLVLEQNDYPGGLAASFTDGRGFVWDIGCHVRHSHYEYYDQLIDRALPDEWLQHRRESCIWVHDRFVPYPFQNNLRHLPHPVMVECVLELIRTAQNNRHHPPVNFSEWIRASFGEGIANHFLLPYNRKIWAHPLETMSYSWIGERIATVKLDQIVENILLQQEDSRWGPNATFRFPARGGTGAVWRAVAAQLPPGTIRYGACVHRIDPAIRRVHTSDGASYPYDYLISALPLDSLTALLGQSELAAAAARLCHSTVHVVGVGFAGHLPEPVRHKTWIYYPDPGSLFNRVTVWSNYSPHVVPDPSQHWALIAEVSESRFKPIDGFRLLDQTLAGFYQTGLASPSDPVVSTWIHTASHGYPVPTIDRDEILDFLQPRLESMGIWSRGRFGGWKYEVANQDHSCMQGVEAVDRILLGTAEITYPHPQLVNNRAAPLPPPPRSMTPPGSPAAPPASSGIRSPSGGPRGTRRRGPG